MVFHATIERIKNSAKMTTHARKISTNGLTTKREIERKKERERESKSLYREEITMSAAAAAATLCREKCRKSVAVMTIKAKVFDEEYPSE